MAKAAKNSGFEVIVLTRVSAHGHLIRSHGFRLINVNLRRSGINPIKEILSIIEIMRLYLKEKPDIVHHVALKPVIYGSIGALFAGIPNVVNALIGLGYIFTVQGIKGTIARLFVLRIYKYLLNLNSSVLILQNTDDVNLFLEYKAISSNRVRLIFGSGVDVNFYNVTPECNGGKVNVLLASRMLESKGIREFIEAARLVKKRGHEFNFLLVGGLDNENPTAIEEAEINGWCNEGIVRWFGHQQDMRPFYLNSNIVCLPSHREGIPKVLLEGASCGRAIIATDVAGCREVVNANVNGILVSLYDINALADAIIYLGTHPNIRQEMGLAGRSLAVEKYSELIIQSQITAVYSELANG